MKTYKFYCDPGHGWMAVKVQELHELGIMFKISSYSYLRGKTAYLEEDCDARMIYSALDFANITYDEDCGVNIEQQIFDMYGSEEAWRNALRRPHRYSLMQQGFFNKQIDPKLLEHLKEECRHLREDY